MKRTDKPTEYILLRGETSSEFDGCDFAIFKITEAWVIKMIDRLQLLRFFKSDRDFSHIAYSETVEGFYTYPVEMTEGLLTGAEAWCFIDIAPDELQNIEEVNSELCGYELVIDSDGYASYRAYAEQNNDSFYTHDFKITSILEQINE